MKFFFKSILYFIFSKPYATLSTVSDSQLVHTILSGNLFNWCIVNRAE